MQTYFFCWLQFVIFLMGTFIYFRFSIRPKLKWIKCYQSWLEAFFSVKSLLLPVDCLPWSTTHQLHWPMCPSSVGGFPQKSMGLSATLEFNHLNQKTIEPGAGTFNYSSATLTLFSFRWPFCTSRSAELALNGIPESALCT